MTEFTSIPPPMLNVIQEVTAQCGDLPSGVAGDVVAFFCGGGLDFTVHQVCMYVLWAEGSCSAQHSHLTLLLSGYNHFSPPSLFLFIDAKSGVGNPVGAGNVCRRQPCSSGENMGCQKHTKLLVLPVSLLILYIM